MNIAIGKQVTKKVPTNTYELIVRNMSGDGDAYENNNSFHKAEDKDAMLRLEQNLFILQEYEKIPSGYQNDHGYTERVTKAVMAKYSDLDEGDVSDMLNDLIGYDVTCEGCLAGLDSVTLFYYNATGVKHEASYTL